MDRNTTPQNNNAHGRHSQNRQLYRSRGNRMLAGVCGGLGELTGIDANLIRLMWLLLVFFGGTGIVIYIIMAIVIPERPPGEEIIDAGHGPRWAGASRDTAIILGLFIILAGLLLLLNSLGWLPISLGMLWSLFWKLFWPLVLVGLGLLLVIGAFWGNRGWWREVRLPESGRILLRSRSDRMFAGVCGGLAKYFNVDPSLVRIIWAVGTLATMGTGILAYLVAALVLPEE